MTSSPSLKGYGTRGKPNLILSKYSSKIVKLPFIKNCKIHKFGLLGISLGYQKFQFNTIYKVDAKLSVFLFLIFLLIYNEFRSFYTLSYVPL